MNTPGAESWIIDVLKAYGLAGLVIFVLTWFVVKLYLRNQELHDTLNEMGREAVRTNEQVTSALSKMASVNEASTESVRQLNTTVQQLLWRSGIKGQE